MGPAHWFSFGAARPASDLLANVTGTFGVASHASVRTRQAGQAHAHTQPNVNGSSSSAAASDGAQCERRDGEQQPWANAMEGGRAARHGRAQRARVPCARAWQQETLAGSVEPHMGVRAQTRRRLVRQCREPCGDRAPGASMAQPVACMHFKAVQKLKPNDSRVKQAIQHSRGYLGLSN